MKDSLEDILGEHGFSIVEHPDEKISEEPSCNRVFAHKEVISKTNSSYRENLCSATCQQQVNKPGELCYYHQKKAQGLFE